MHIDQDAPTPLDLRSLPGLRDKASSSLLAGLALISIAGLAARPAEACSCLLPEPGPSSPVDERQGLPTNAPLLLARTYVQANVGRSLALYDVSGNPIETSQTTLTASGRGTIDVLTPIEELDPNEKYTLWDGELLEGESVLSFTTSEQADLDPPPVPTAAVERMVSEGPDPGSPCGGDHHYVTFAIESEGLWLLVTRDPSTFDEETLEGTVMDQVAAGYGSFTAGRSICQFNWPGAGGEVVEDFYFGALDEAGNFSGWSDPVVVEMPTTGDPTTPAPIEEPGGCTCVTLPGHGWLAGLTSAFVLFGWLVRGSARRRPSSRGGVSRTRTP